MLDIAKQDMEQEALQFRPEEWGMRRGTRTKIICFSTLARITPRRMVHSVSCCNSMVK